MKNNNSPILIKTTGGTTAQLLALTNALYVGNRLGRSFRIKHYVDSTGTYWPLQIQSLMYPSELDSETSIEDLQSGQEQVGQLVSDFALRRFGINKQKLLHGIQHLGLDRHLRRLRGEIVIGGDGRRLDLVTRKTREMSGNFVPISDRTVFQELSSRFNRANLPNPFDSKLPKIPIVIHYRLGDMRKMSDRVKNQGGHGVVDPAVFSEILGFMNSEVGKRSVVVVSDEPEVARRALEVVGINCETLPSVDVWTDLQIIAGARLFIGSLSQFSMFGAMVVGYQGGASVLPSSIYGRGNLQTMLKVDRASYYQYRYLRSDHWLFLD